jgi:glycosyltransferase involved in cell wall biosynthesis
MKILAIGDLGDNIFNLKKYVKRSKIHIINFPRKQAELLTYPYEGIEFFDSLLISKQVKKIKQIKDSFDLCIVMSWAGARIAYLAGLNYIMYFTGGDITTPPFIKNPCAPYLKNPIFNRNFIERSFYRKVFDTAIAVLAPTEEYYNHLKKYRKDAIRINRILVDHATFNDKVKPVDLPKKKFTFLSAQKFGLEKGFDTIFEALRLCRTDFEIWQVEWFTQRTPEEKEINKKLLEKMPPQMKFIPLIKREELPRYYMFADAILGQMRVGIQGGIERDSAYCRRPVLCYTDSNKPTTLDGKKVIPPFLPKSRNPQELAELIDKVVESREFREKLAEEEYNYLRELSDPDKVILEWENIFEDLIKKYGSINRKSRELIKIEIFIANIVEKLIYTRTMRERNILGWGKAEYERLTK